MSRNVQEANDTEKSFNDISGEFSIALTQELLRSVYNDHCDNVDYDRFSDLRKPRGFRYWFQERLSA